ncbi:putative mitochondrial GrpE protein-like precursor [Zalerion maritima]|uniref:GrpE protein homolog n=1 Tax=Zalerion maritima TaxID=339359 RepID=A0AAD5RKV4_9PEZI|nr:putative mitochondrial GrpE protein-like precursor [Zalerion maritima]
MLRQTISTSSRTIGSYFRVAAAQTPVRTVPTQFLAAASTTALRSSILPRIARWYSDEAKAPPEEANKGEKKAAEAKEGEAAPSDPNEALKKDIETKAKEALEWKDRYLRSVADFRNLQDRQAREMKSTRDFAIQKFAKDLVDSVDNLDRALVMVPEEKLKADENAEHLKDLVNLYEGIKMTETILLQTLQKHGMERYDPHGAAFNPNEHEATFMAPQPDKEHNTVFHTQQKGFKLHGRVLRPAKVGVVRNK